MGLCCRSALVSALGLLLASPVLGQDYEALYGPIRDVSLEELLRNPEMYVDRGVRTSGRVDLDPSSRQLVLSAGVGLSVWLLPVRELQNQFAADGMRYVGQNVEVTGLFSSTTFSDPNSLMGGPRGAIRFWAFLGPPEKRDKEIQATSLTLEDLLRGPERYDGRMVRVVGQFRGRNLFRDLPSSSQAKGSDWVLKDDIFAVWVSGERPRGDGFRLDPTLKRDTGKWLEVTGRVRVRRNIVYLNAEDVRLTSAPLRVDAGADPTPTPTPRPRRAPVVVFSLPLDGEQIPQSTVFQVQFSKDMDERSFQGRVVLRYAGPRLPGDRLFDGLRVQYDGGLRALKVDPGDVLRPGREVVLLLLRGIEDVEGMPLESRPGVSVGEAEVADALRFYVGGEFAGN